MDLNQLTVKTRAALDGAHQLAVARHNQEITPEHVLFALLSDPEGVIYPLLQQVGVQPRQVRDQVDAALEKYPKVFTPGMEPRFSADVTRLLQTAGAEAEAAEVAAALGAGCPMCCPVCRGEAELDGWAGCGAGCGVGWCTDGRPAVRFPSWPRPAAARRASGGPRRAARPGTARSPPSPRRWRCRRAAGPGHFAAQRL